MKLHFGRDWLKKKIALNDIEEPYMIGPTMPEYSVVIPSRYASSRLPGKPLIDLDGKTMIRRVMEQAELSYAKNIVVAVDDHRIYDEIKDNAIISKVCLTRKSHESGSDRILEVVDKYGWSDDHIIVNVQGDEPLIPPSVIDQVASLLAYNMGCSVASLCERITNLEDLNNPNVVKVVRDNDRRALYFSRAPIPYARDGFNMDDGMWFRHIGIYAYRVSALRLFSELPISKLEQSESLEQLRFLDYGVDIIVGDAVKSVPEGVDTEADAERVRSILKGEGHD